MNSRIILFSLFVTSGITMNAMSKDQAAELLKQASEGSQKTEILVNLERLMAYAPTLNALASSMAPLLQQELDKIVTPEKLQKYVSDVQAIRTHTLYILGTYKAFLNEQASYESEKAQAQANFDAYKKSLDTLKETRNILYNTYWAQPSTQKIYVPHPETGELLEAVKFVKDKTQETEAALKPNRTEELFSSALLLSVPMNAFHETLATLKAIQSLPK